MPRRHNPATREMFLIRRGRKRFGSYATPGPKGLPLGIAAVASPWTAARRNLNDTAHRFGAERVRTEGDR